MTESARLTTIMHQHPKLQSGHLQSSRPMFMNEKMATMTAVLARMNARLRFGGRSTEGTRICSLQYLDELHWKEQTLEFLLDKQWGHWKANKFCLNRRHVWRWIRGIPDGCWNEKKITKQNVCLPPSPSWFVSKHSREKFQRTWCGIILD